MQKENKQVFSFNLVVTSDFIDDLNHVNNIVYLQWINKAATKHWEKLSDNRINKAYSWVALRHEIDYLKPAFLNDKITVKTWIGETSGVKSIRYVEIYNRKKLLAKAKTVWVLLDALTMHPKRIKDDILNILKQNS